MATSDTTRAALLAAVKSGSLQTWLLERYKDVDSASLFATIDANNAGKLCAVLGADIDAALSSCLPGHENADPAVSAGKALEGAVALLRTVVQFMLQLAADASKPLPASFFEAAFKLNTAIYTLDMTHKIVRPCVNDISRLCERLYLQERDSRAVALVPACAAFLMSDVTGLEFSEASLKRLYAIRKGIVAIDVDDEDSAFTRQLMLKCFTKREILSSGTGRKLLACTMTCSPTMPKACHTEIKATLFTPTTMPPAQIQRWIGEVYLRAWEEAGRVGAGEESGEGKDSKPASVVPTPIRVRIEEDVFQDVLHAGLYASRPDIFAAMGRILEKTIEERGRPGKKAVDAALVRVYEPLLWRAMAAPNGQVRHNAARMFSNVAIMGRTCTPEELGGNDTKRDLLQKQIDSLIDLTEDDNPAVREVTIRTIGQVLSFNWKNLPTQVTHKLLERVLGGADDLRSPAVRLQAVDSICGLICAEDAETSHAVLLKKGHFDHLSHLLHDKNERVRAAVIRLLETMQKFKGSFKDSWFNLGAPKAGAGAAEEGEGGEVGGPAAVAGAMPHMLKEVLARLVLDADNEELATGLVRLLGPVFFSSPAKAGGSTAPEAAKKKDKKSQLTSTEEAAEAAMLRLSNGLTNYELATMTVLRYAAALPTTTASKPLLAVIAASMWRKVREWGMEVNEGIAGLGSGGDAEEEEEDVSEDGFVRRKRGREAPAGGGKKGKGPAGKAPAGSKPAPNAMTAIVSKTRIISVVLRAAVSIWSSLEAALPASGCVGESPASPDTGGVTTEWLTEGQQVHKIFGTAVNAETVSALLRIFSTRLSLREGGGGADLGALRTSVTLSLLDVAQRLPGLAAVLKGMPPGGTKKGSRGAVEAGGGGSGASDVDYTSLSDSLWHRLVTLTPSELGYPSTFQEAYCASEEGKSLLSSLVSCMVAFGRGVAVMDCALASIQAGVAACTAALNGEGEAAAGLSETALIDAMKLEEESNMHPFVAVGVLERVLDLAKRTTGAPPGAVGGEEEVLDAGIFLNVKRMTDTLNVMVTGMASVGTMLRAGPVACASPAGAFVSRLSVLCTGVWCCLDAKALAVRFGGTLGAPVLHAIPQAAFEMADAHLGDAAAWLSNDLWVLLLTHAHAAKLGCGSAMLTQGNVHAAGYAAALTASFAIASLITAFASDMASFALSVAPPLRLLIDLTATAGVPPVTGIPGFEQMDEEGVDTTSVAGLEWLTTGADLYATHADADEELVSTLRSAMYRCHATCTLMASKLWACACGTTSTSFSVDTPENAADGAGPAFQREQREAYVALGVEDRRDLTASLVRLVTTGDLACLTGAEDTDSLPAITSAVSSSWSYATMKQVYADLCVVAKSGAELSKADLSEGKASFALKALLRHLLPAGEAAVPEGTLTALAAKAGTPLSLLSLGCPALSALIELSVSRRWSAGACVEAICARVRTAKQDEADLLRALAVMTYALQCTPSGATSRDTVTHARELALAALVEASSTLTPQSQAAGVVAAMLVRLPKPAGGAAEGAGAR